MNLKLYAWLTAFTIFFFSTSSAQYNWENIGPDNLGSPTRALAFDAQGNLLAGSQGGGLWRSTTRGESWQRVLSYDAAGANPNITSIAVSGSTIYVATGAAEFTRPYGVVRLGFPATYSYQTDPTGFKGYIDGMPGGGVYVSTDNGATWSNANATTRAPFGAETANFKGPFANIQKVLVKGSRVFVASAAGLFYSDDQLQNLTQVQGTDFIRNSIIFDVEAAAGNVIFATAHEDGNNPRDSLYISQDNGASFTSVKDPLLYAANTELGRNRIEVAVAPSDPNIVYMAGSQSNQEVNGIFRYLVSENRWSSYGPRGSAGFAPLSGNGRNAFVLAVLPDNPNELIVAGNSWFTFKQDRGWSQTAVHTNPTAPNFLARSQFAVLFDPGNPQVYYVGTSRQIFRTANRGTSFSLRSKGYEAGIAYSVASFKTETVGEEPIAIDAVLGGTLNNGSVYNRHFSAASPARQGFGTIWTTPYSEADVSYTHPGLILVQGSDGAPIRSFNAGSSFDQFFGPPISPQVANLTPATTDTMIDRSNDRSAGGNLFNAPLPAQSAWVVDQYIPEALVNNSSITIEELQAQAPSYVFFCSRNYIWLVSNPFGEALQVKWNRITPRLVSGDEYFTAITVSGDDQHTVYAGTNKGNLWRIDRAHDLENFDVNVNIRQINEEFVNNLFFVNGRWISSLAVDPKNPSRLVVGYAGFGGNASSVPSFIWVTNNARDPEPVFGQFIDAPKIEPVYALHFVNDPGQAESVLLVGGHTNLYSARSITSPFTNLYTASWTREFAPDFGAVPVFDIHVRRFSSRLTENALIREEVRPRTLPDGTVVLDTIELERDNLLLTRDNTVFVATHGRGYWTTSSIRARGGSPEGPVVSVEADAVRIYPNPAASLATVEVDLTAAATFRHRLLALDGREVLGPAAVQLQAGRHELPIETARLAPGIYLLESSIETGARTQMEVHKLLVVR
ncbi:MAG: hypothetical protein NW241_00105 [Bacteroidia bacterium]|nr:hypothetical protein [Bacteroidia bacterium]